MEVNIFHSITFASFDRIFFYRALLIVVCFCLHRRKIISVAGVVILSVLAVVLSVRWWLKRRRNRGARMEEDEEYMEALGEEMKRQIKRERDEKRKVEKENIYEEI